MKAKVFFELAGPNKNGKTALTVNVNVRKEFIIDMVNYLIYKRVNNPNEVNVSNVVVEIYNYKREVVNKWIYKPTIR